MRACVAAWIAAGDHLVASFHGSATELMTELMRQSWPRAATSKSGSICRLIVSGARNFPELARHGREEFWQPVRRIIEAALRRGIASGEFRPVSTEAIVCMLLAVPIHLVLQPPGGCGPAAACPDDSVDLIEAQVDLLMKGLMPRHGDHG